MRFCDRSLLARPALGDDEEVLERVRVILEQVRLDGDEALRRWTEQLDRVKLQKTCLKPEPAWLELVEPPVLEAMRQARERLEAFHRHQGVNSWIAHDLGGVVGQMLVPLHRVGCYAPGGRAPLPSTILHTVTLARLAGVKQIVLVTPPGPEHPLQVNPVMLAAACLAGATEVWPLGGAQAIGALTYGTQSLQRVDKIVGPGNTYVTLAKKLVYGQVGLDGVAGPTETMIVADEQARPEWVAADLLAQAEHDPAASALLLTPSRTLAEAVDREVERQLADLPRREIVQKSLDTCSGIVLTETLEEAVELAWEYAPEHLCLAVRDPWKWLPRVRAGGVFLGEHSCEVLGDYVAGPSHVMPTSGTARFASALNLLDFVRVQSLVGLDADTCGVVAPAAARLATAETLEGHARAARLRQS